MRLDLNAAYIDDTVNVWAIHAGKGKRYHKYFIEHQVIFLDMPSLNLTADLIANETSLRENIAISEKISSYYRNRQSGNLPSRNPADYRQEAKKKKYNHMVSSAKRFVEDIKKGDLIVIPPKTQYDQVVFGIVQDNFDPNKKISVHPYGADRLNSRKVKWLSTNILKRDLPGDLAIRLENPNTIVSLTGGIRQKALAAAYKNYTTDSLSKIDIECPFYRGKNPLETLEVQKLINFFTAIYNMHEEGILDQAQNLTLMEIASNYYDEDLIESIETEFHSPGFYRVVSKTTALGLFIILGITLAAGENFNAMTAQNLNLINTQSAGSDQENARLLSIIQSTVNSVSPTTLQEINDAGKKAKENLNIKTNTKVSN